MLLIALAPLDDFGFLLGLKGSRLNGSGLACLQLGKVGERGPQAGSLTPYSVLSLLSVSFSAALQTSFSLSPPPSHGHLSTFSLFLFLGLVN